MAALDLLASWPGTTRGTIVLRPEGEEHAGQLEVVLPWASLSKVAMAVLALRLVADGLVGLDDEVGPRGATIRHLLSHASGLAPEEVRSMAAPGERRIYSNSALDLLAAHFERWTGTPIGELLDEEVFGPLAMASTSLRGEPASGVEGSTRDLGRLLAEMRTPALLDERWWNEMRRIQFPGLAGVLPGVGRFDPCDWGLGVEVKGSKAPHWTAPSMGPRTFGHFGRAGGFIVVDPDRSLGVCTLGDEPFGPRMLEVWPVFLEALCAESS